MEDDFIGYYETLLQYHLPGLDTSKLSDKAWAKKIAQLEDIRNREREASLKLFGR
jgi:hypothetical protein